MTFLRVQITVTSHGDIHKVHVGMGSDPTPPMTPAHHMPCACTHCTLDVCAVQTTTTHYTTLHYSDVLYHGIASTVCSVLQCSVMLCWEDCPIQQCP